jgi:pimeloyl-ACP methyl ester carboxylesterase
MPKSQNPPEISIDSQGVPLGAWHLRAESEALTGPGGRPCVVMGHGFAGTRDAGLLPFARRFAAAGLDVIVFDYRGFGGSGGSPRQHVSHWKHREDYRAAIAAARSLDGVDPGRIVLWGSSYSGGHVLPVAVRDGRIAAVISQGAAMDGMKAVLEIVRYAGAAQLARLGWHAGRDFARAALRRKPHLITVVGPPGSLAVITAPGALEGYGNITGPMFRNEMLARGIPGIALNRPVRVAGRLSCPALIVLAEQDNIAPVSAVRAVAHAAPDAELVELPCGHFDLYVGEIFERSVAAQVEFLQRRLAVPAKVAPTTTSVDV